MSSREFAEWMAYAEIEPFGEVRADLRVATVAALFAEANRDRKRRRKPYSVLEFMDLFRGVDSRPALSRGQAVRGNDGEGRGNDDGRRTTDEGERKRAELWANVKAWALGAPKSEESEAG